MSNVKHEPIENFIGNEEILAKFFRFFYQVLTSDLQAFTDIHYCFVALIMAYAGGFGITAGAHRLWTHRSYKAKLPLRILLVMLNTMSYGMKILEWARDHRVHHKYSETDADPYNVKRY